MSKSALLGLLVALLLPLTGYFVIKGVSKNAVVMPRHYIYDSVITKTVDGKQVWDTLWHRLPDFTFTNQLGKKVGWKELEGKVVVADFFFTRCPTICPQLTKNMKRMQDGITNAQRVGNKMPNFIHFLSFTVDPERDSVAALKNWADRFQINPDNWWLLTGDKKAIYDLSIEHMKVLAQDGKGEDTSFIHTDYMVLIDQQRNIRGYYHGLDTSAISRLSRDIVLLSLEKNPGRKKFYEGKLEMLAIVFLLTIIGIGVLLIILKKDKQKNEPDHQKG